MRSVRSLYHDMFHLCQSNLSIFIMFTVDHNFTIYRCHLEQYKKLRLCFSEIIFLSYANSGLISFTVLYYKSCLYEAFHNQTLASGPSGHQEDDSSLNKLDGHAFESIQEAECIAIFPQLRMSDHGMHL